jgi:hypothetical protein
MWMRLLRELPTLDDIGITVQQKGDESRGVQIPRADVDGGPGGVSTGPDPGKGKGKVAAPVRSDDEVSLDDDHPCRGGGYSIAAGSSSAGPHQQGSRSQWLSPYRSSTHRWQHRWQWHQAGPTSWTMQRRFRGLLWTRKLQMWPW